MHEQDPQPFLWYCLIELVVEKNPVFDNFRVTF